MLYMVTFTINIPPMLAYIPYMDPMGMTQTSLERIWSLKNIVFFWHCFRRRMVGEKE